MSWGSTSSSSRTTCPRAGGVVYAAASGPKHCTGLVGWCVSGVSMPSRRMVSRWPPRGDHDRVAVEHLHDAVLSVGRTPLLAEPPPRTEAAAARVRTTIDFDRNEGTPDRTTPCPARHAASDRRGLRRCGERRHAGHIAVCAARATSASASSET